MWTTRTWAWVSNGALLLGAAAINVPCWFVDWRLGVGVLGVLVLKAGHILAVGGKPNDRPSAQ